MREVTADALGVNDAVGPWGPWEPVEVDTWLRAQHRTLPVFVSAKRSRQPCCGAWSLHVFVYHRGVRVACTDGTSTWQGSIQDLTGLMLSASVDVNVLDEHEQITDELYDLTEPAWGES